MVYFLNIPQNIAPFPSFLYTSFGIFYNSKQLSNTDLSFPTVYKHQGKEGLIWVWELLEHNAHYI